MQTQQTHRSSQPGATPQPRNDVPPTANPRPFDETQFRTDEQERNAMRAFLQRSEVRLSTMHRVAVGFLSGAGLLYLFPVFFKDATVSIIKEFLNYTPHFPQNSGVSGILLVVLFYIVLLYPFLLSLAIPVIAMLLLAKDIVRFYFMGHSPGFPEELFNPRFVLTGVGFSPDESEAVKNRILAFQYGSDLINFVLPFDERKSRYFGAVIDKKRLIVPKTRKLPKLIQRGIIENATGKPLEDLKDDDTVNVQYSVPNGDASANGMHSVPQYYRERTVKEIDRFNAALGLAGMVDRDMYQEVAKSEVSLVRHALNLRRLVLRYFQALLIMMWSALISLAMLPFLQDTNKRFPLPIVFALSYLVWSLATPLVARLPVYWLVRFAKESTRKESLRELRKRDGLENFENWANIACYIAIFSAAVALILEIGLRVI